MSEIRGPIEAILFVAELPISAQELAEVVEAPLSDVEETLGEIERELLERRSDLPGRVRRERRSAFHWLQTKPRRSRYQSLHQESWS